MQPPLSKKLFSVLAITLMIVMTPFIAWRYEHLRMELREQSVVEAKQAAVRIAESVKPSVWNEYITPEEVTFSAQVTAAILEAEMRSENIIEIVIRDSFKQQLLGYYKLEDDTVIPLLNEQVTPLPVDEQKRYIYPIFNDKTRIGEVEIIYQAGKINDSLKQALSMELIQLTIVSLLILALLFAALRQALLRPIQSLQIAQQAIESMSEAVVVADAQFRITDVNNAYEKISGQNENALLYRHPSFFIRKDQTLVHLWDEITNIREWTGEIVLETIDGRLVPAWLRLNEVIHDNHFVCYVCVVTDITEKKEAEEQLHQMAYFDALTTLPNRTYFMESLSREIQNSHRHKKRFGLLFIDLDNFKWINDTHGHTAGDLFLTSIAERFKSRLRKSDYIFRLSGDEFTAITTDVKNEQQLEVLANDLIRIANQEIAFDDGKRISAGASIGVALYPRDGNQSEALIQHADAAMYEAKEMGRNQTCFYSKELEQQRKRNRETQTELQQAIKENQLTLVYQPKVRHPRQETLTGQHSYIDGAEALIRWQHPDKGLLSPNAFINIAEQSDLIIDIGYWVIQAACKQLAVWQQSHLAHLSLAINLSPRQLRHPNLVSDVDQLLKTYAIDPARLELELTESAIIENIEQSLITLNKLKALGVTLAMDDFGTGFSSLSYLKLLPIDVIKIDRSFIAGLPYDEDDAVIVRAIFSMANAMNLTVVAEGIENVLQEKYLLAEGCTHSQGFFYSKPLTSEELMAWAQAYEKQQDDNAPPNLLG